MTPRWCRCSAPCLRVWPGAAPARRYLPWTTGGVWRPIWPARACSRAAQARVRLCTALRLGRRAAGRPAGATVN
jgi:hypothetical protein